ncbi:C-type lectin domain family 17, member A-like [Saccostrea echinata]|uniref:C-type lectin domain family 17, member A-like n=1 Tax=Saccostrea echinata TaxID=191078 RepID=UPI002A7FF1C8|nr:C-type lectin domain family 17, member A-like [Saccostrea echinata]
MQSPQNFLAGSEEEWTYYQKTKKGCDSPWLEMLGHCYLHNKKKVTWAEAKMWCESRDAYLVEIESLIESTWVALAFFLQGPCPADIFSECVAWTGGNDLVIEGHYQWNDSPLAMNYTNWLPGEPSTIYPAQGESRDCVDILKNGKWNDRPCSFLNSFICEMN